MFMPLGRGKCLQIDILSFLDILKERRVVDKFWLIVSRVDARVNYFFLEKFYEFKVAYVVREPQCHGHSLGIEKCAG